jgi:cytidylate kinase
MAIVTISREFGSKGSEVSRYAAERLGYAYVDKETIEKVMIQYGLISFDRFYDAQYTIWDRFFENNQQIISMFSKTIHEFSKNDKTILVGRAGFILLTGFENVLHVLIRAPFEVRVQNTMRSMKITDRERAEELVLRNDQSRRSFVQTFYRADTSNTDWFNIALDTSVVPPETAAEWIADAARQLDSKEKNPEKTTFALESDEVLEDVVQKQLKELNG